MDVDGPLDAEGNHDWICGWMGGQHAHDGTGLMLVLIECCNQLEALKLEMALEREGRN